MMAETLVAVEREREREREREQYSSEQNLALFFGYAYKKESVIEYKEKSIQNALLSVYITDRLII